MLWWCPVIHWWSLVSLWPARLPAGASAEHQSALTTTPALYLWSLPPLVHCGKTRGLELEKWIYSSKYLNKSKNIYSFMNAASRSYWILKMFKIFACFQFACCAPYCSHYILIYHRHHRPDTTSSQTFPTTISPLSSLPVSSLPPGTK